MKKSIVWWSILVLCLGTFQAVHALELNGLKLSPIPYEPGKKIVNTYTIAGTDRLVQAELGGDLSEYIRLTEIQQNQFDLIIEFPSGYIPSGSYSFSLHVRELAGEDSSGVGSLLSVTKVFEVVVYAYDKFITAALTAPHVNEGTPVNFQLQLQSRGYVDIAAVKADIIIYNAENTSVGSVSTSTKPLKALSSLTFSTPFNTSGLLSGAYHAQAIVHYDEKTTNASAEFNIGAIDLALLNYTSRIEPGFSEMNLRVKNNWGNSLRNVHASVFLQETEVLQTPTIILQPWQEGDLVGIMKTDLPPGLYSGKVRLFYEQEQKDVPISLQVVAAAVAEAQPAEPQSSSLAMLLAFLVLLTAVFIIFMAMRIARGSHEL